MIMENPLIKKLLIKPGYRVLVSNSPMGFVEQLHPLPEGVEIVAQGSGSFDLVLLFVRSRAEIETLAQAALTVVRPGGLAWFAYPKRSKNVETDINRDTGWETVYEADWGPVTQIAIDETWSALRFKPNRDIQRTSNRWPGKSS
jgi:hypothetical protein